MLCKPDSAEYTRSLEQNPTLPYCRAEQVLLTACCAALTDYMFSRKKEKNKFFEDVVHSDEEGKNLNVTVV